MEIMALLKMSWPAGSEAPRTNTLLIDPTPADPAHRTRPFRSRSLRTALMVAFMIFLTAATARAQNFAGFGDVDASGTSYHRFVRPGEATVEILLLGNTGQAGIYVVGVNIDLAEFMALSGVSFGTSSGREKTSVTVRHYRQQGTHREIIFEALVEELLQTPANLPLFKDGDIIYIERRSTPRISWFDILRSASSIATLVFVAERLIKAVR